MKSIPRTFGAHLDRSNDLVDRSQKVWQRPLIPMLVGFLTVQPTPMLVVLTSHIDDSL